MSGKLYVVGTPIGNLQDITFRAVDVLKRVDVIFCEDTRRSLKLLNHFKIKKPLKSAPYFREREAAEKVLEVLAAGQDVAFVVDAGMPAISDPGAILLSSIRSAGFETEVVGGVSALSYFLAGIGVELEQFLFVGFLPEKTLRRERWMREAPRLPIIFFESPHRIEGTLKIFKNEFPHDVLILGKELSKISEAYFQGNATELLTRIPSWKGEWLGLWLRRAEE